MSAERIAYHEWLWGHLGEVVTVELLIGGVRHEWTGVVVVHAEGGYSIGDNHVGAIEAFDVTPLGWDGKNS